MFFCIFPISLLTAAGCRWFFFPLGRSGAGGDADADTRDAAAAAVAT